MQRGAYDSVDWYAIPDPLPLPDELYQDNWIGRAAIALLERKPNGQPWFLEVSHQAPHPPMDITASMMETVRHRPPFPPPYQCDNGRLCTDDNIQMARQNYAAKIERLDWWLGQYVSLVDARGELANTIVCLASDHGEMLGDRSSTAKSKPWQSSMSVPLICSGPGINVNAVVSRPVTTMDLAATFIDFAGGLKPPNMTSTR